MPKLNAARVVVAATLVGMRMLRGLMWVLAIAVLGCVVSTSLAEVPRIVSLGDTATRRVAATTVVVPVSVRLHVTRGTLNPFHSAHHLGI